MDASAMKATVSSVCVSLVGAHRHEQDSEDARGQAKLQSDLKPTHETTVWRRTEGLELALK